MENIQPNRRLVLCLDGTWNSSYDREKQTNTADGHVLLKPTNTLKTCRAVLPVDPETHLQQITYYDLGVGALAEYPGTSNRFLYFMDRVLGGAWGAGFEGNVEDALHFLALNFQEGDEVFIFGFSRGAATARAVTTFLEWNGGLPVKGDAYYLPQFFRSFVVSRGERSVAAAELKKINDRHPERPLEPFRRVPVKYLGVWDTVVSLGSRFQATGETTSTSARSFYAGKKPAECVQNARQALAIDEARFDFRPDIWTGRHAHQTMRQRWFAGVHSNVGGGYGNDGLANLAFQWILDGARDAGLKVDTNYIGYYRGFAKDSLYRTSSLFYRSLDFVRRRKNRGIRRLVGQPSSANLDIDPSVFVRMATPPRDLAMGSKPEDTINPYRPENVLLFLASLPDVDTYVQSVGYTGPIPDDVRKRIEELRPDAARMMAELSPSPSRP
jgi:uncharacterized protein (DUF2235 family)